MPTCLICSRADRDQILAALATSTVSLRSLERQYAVSRSVLQRHRTQGCPAERPTAPIAAAGTELERVIVLLTEIKMLLEVSVQQSRHVEDDYTGTVAPHLEWNRL